MSLDQTIHGAIDLFHGLKLVELPVCPGSQINGKSLAASRLMDSEAMIVGI